MMSVELAGILSRIESRLRALNLSAHRASMLAGRPDAIRNMRRAVKERRREGISTTTLSALAPVLQTSQEWLLTGGGNPEQAAESVVSDDMTDEDALNALLWSFEALNLGNPDEVRVLARAVLRAIRTPQSHAGSVLSLDERRSLVRTAIELFRKQ